MNRITKFSVMLLLAHAALLPLAKAASLNDSGQSTCYDTKGEILDCVSSTDDGRYGRDAAAREKRLSKQGAGIAGFDFTKISNNGKELPINSELGGEVDEWACTKDNLTNLMWEVKSSSAADLRFMGHRYARLSSGGTERSETPSDSEPDNCNRQLIGGSCTTDAYVVAINAAKLCGYSDWRLPNVSELVSIVDYGAKNSPAIDPVFFPNTAPNWHWTQAVAASNPSGVAWDVHFGRSGVIGGGNIGTNYAVRLVRSAK